MSKIFLNLGIIIFILGTIGSIYMAYQFGNVVDFKYASKIYYERNWFLTIIYFIGGAFSTVLLGSIFIGLAEILDKLDIVMKRQLEDK